MVKKSGTSRADSLSGTNGDDELFGQNGNDKLFGGAGNDYLNGGNGADVLNGGAGDRDQAVYWDAARGVTADLQNRSANTGEAKGDRYFGVEGLWGSRFNDVLRGNGGDNELGGNNGNDRLEGRGGDDKLFGQNGNDKLFGGAGNDYLNGGNGADVLNGGAGDRDQAVYWDAARGVTADLQNRSANTGEAKGDRYFGVEGFWGSRFNDVLRGNGGDNELGGDNGNDRLEGRGGDDFLFGQNGNDKLFGGGGNDYLNGGNGADVLNGGAGDRDQAVYWDAARGVTADLQNRSANTGEAKGDRYFGVEGLWGSRFNDVLRGNGGDNELGGNNGNDRLEGRGGDDKLFGQNGNDKLFGGGGEDRLNGGAGADVLNGGAGDRDRAVYWDAARGVTADLQNRSANTGEAKGDRYFGVEGFWGSRFNDVLRGNGGDNELGGDNGNDRLEGRGGDDFLFGNNGNDKLFGGGGDDRLNGGAGADVLNGGAGGNDQAVYWDAARGVTADLQNRSANTGEAKGDRYFGVEGFWGSRFNDVLRGNGGDNELGGDNGNDRLEGRGGDDFLFGNNGNDKLFGGGGDDYLNGGTGADVLNGGAGDDDRAAYWNSARAITADLQNRSANTGEAKGDRYFGIEGLDGSRFNDVLRGNGGDNRIFANDGNDRLEGRGGDDELFGQNGNDKLFGGDGEDRLNGGAGADVLDGGAGDRDQAVYWDSESGITADLQNSSANTGEAAGDVYIGIEGLNGSHQDDFLFGDGTGNRIWGDEGDDVINGRGGDDVLGGAEGRDILMGGDGADGFAFWAPLTAGNADTITDFSVDDDMFYLDRKVFSGLAEGVLAASAFSGSGAATTGSGAAVVYDSGTGEVSYDSDGAGGADARLFATITAGLALTAAEFEIYA